LRAIGLEVFQNMSCLLNRWVPTKDTYSFVYSPSHQELARKAVVSLDSSSNPVFHGHDPVSVRPACRRPSIRESFLLPLVHGQGGLLSASSRRAPSRLHQPSCKEVPQVKVVTLSYQALRSLQLESAFKCLVIFIACHQVSFRGMQTFFVSDFYPISYFLTNSFRKL